MSIWEHPLEQPTYEKRRYVVVIEIPVDEGLPFEAMPPELDAESDGDAEIPFHNSIGDAIRGAGGTVISSRYLP